MSRVYSLLKKAHRKQQEKVLRKRYDISDGFKFGDMSNIHLSGSDITLGNGSYINSGRLVSGENAPITIGEWCAIGHNINFIAVSHDIEYPTGPKKRSRRTEAAINIGDHVWIGSNVFILQGITVGDHSIIGANSVVTRDEPEGAIVGGVPAKLIRYKKRYSND